MYEKGPSAQELEAFGLLLEDVETDPVFEIWPENWESLQVFLLMRTQWRTGMGGPTGLDYGVFPVALKALGVKKKSNLEVMLAVQQMELAALAVINKE